MAHPLAEPIATPPSEPVAGELDLDVKKIAEKKPILAFYGPDKLVQRATARTIAQKAKRSLLEVSYTADASADLSPQAGL